MRSTNLAIVLFAATALVIPMTHAAIIAGPITNPFNQSSYYLLAQNNWTGSEAEAITLGGHLATTNDAAESAWIFDTLADFGGVSRALWIGLNDAAVEGTFVWASGEPVGYTNWGLDEPNNNAGNEDFSHTFPSGDSRFPTWNDAPNSASSFGFGMKGVGRLLRFQSPGEAVCWIWLV